MEGFKGKHYLHTTRKRFDPVALGISLIGLVLVGLSIAGDRPTQELFDGRSAIIVFIGTLTALLFQFDFGSLANSAVIVVRSFLGSPEKKLLEVHRSLDHAIMANGSLTELREGAALDGELLNDVIYMYHQGLLYDEIDAFVTGRIKDQFFARAVAVQVLQKAALIAPALGLLGTVTGLIGVLSSLSNPAAIGPSMSLALMTTAYGAGLGSLLFTPMAGRLEHHNDVFLQFHQQLMSKVGLLLHREDRSIDSKQQLSRQAI